MLQCFETLRSVNIDVDVPLWHFLKWESTALGLNKCFCGEKMVIAKMNWTLLLITEVISLLDLRKYANSMLISTSNYVPFHLRQSGTFTPYLTGKFIQYGAAKMSLLFRPQWRNNSVWRWHVIQYKSMFIDIHEWLLQVCVTLQGSPFKPGKSVEMCWNYVVCLSKEQKVRGIWIFPPGVFVNGVLHDVYRGYISSVNLHNVNSSRIKKNDLYF